MTTQDTNRLLMEIEHTMRAINREIINPEIPEMTVDGMRPVICLVAGARARYLKVLVELGEQASGNLLSDEQIDQLARRRREYDELARAAKALETAIQRGYLDVVSEVR